MRNITLTGFKCAYTALLFGSLLLSSTAARAQTWSSIGSGCQPGTDSAGLYTFNGPTFEFVSGAIGTIKTRCPVSNPLDSGVPVWNTIDAGYVDPDGTGTEYQVDAQLYRVSRSTGAVLGIATFDSSSFAATGPTTHGVTFSHTFDFSNYAYFVTLTVIRGDTGANPGVWSVQLK